MLIRGLGARYVMFSLVTIVLLPSYGVTQKKAPPPLANSIVLVIRHAEKPDKGDGDGLTPAGVARAKAYSSYFSKLRIDGKPLQIDTIFASADSKNSHRPRLTVEPLAKSLNEMVDVRFKNKDYMRLVTDMETHYYGKDIVICWHHGNIPGLLGAFGAPTSLIPGGKWPSETYDWVIELKFDANGKLMPRQSHRLSEHLMPGDPK